MGDIRHVYVNRYNGTIHKISQAFDGTCDTDLLEEFFEQASWDATNSRDELLKYALDFGANGCYEVEFTLAEQRLIDSRKGDDDDEEDEEDDEEDEDEDEDEEEDDEPEESWSQPMYANIQYGASYCRCPKCEELMDQPKLVDILRSKCRACGHVAPLHEFIRVKGHEECASPL